MVSAHDVDEQTILGFSILEGNVNSTFLISNGATFDEAKAQAQQDVLAIFNYSKDGISHSENMDITQAGEDGRSTEWDTTSMLIPDACMTNFLSLAS